MRAAVTCPKGCGSTSFRAQRRGGIVEEFMIDEGTGQIINRWAMAEAGGPLQLSCTECGHSWRTARDLDLALIVEQD
jgi:hypothetical protein